MFLTDDKLIATGYDKVPFLYKKTGNNWAMASILDQGITGVKKSKIGGNSF